MSANLLDYFRDHLVAQGIVRKPGDLVGKAAGLHPMYLEPVRGAPAPGDSTLAGEADAKTVLSAFQATAVPSGSFESWLNREHVEVRYRTLRPQDYPAIEKAIREQFVDRRNWVTATGLRVVESGEWTRSQRLGSDGKAVTWASEYFFQTYSTLAPHEQ